MSLQVTEARIFNWAAWARAGSAVRSLGYKSPTLTLLRDNVGGDRWNPPSVAVSDDEGMAVDIAVTRLFHRKPDLHRALYLHYVVGKSFRDVAREMGGGVSHQTVSGWVSQAVSWIDGHFDGVEADAA